MKTLSDFYQLFPNRPVAAPAPVSGVPHPRAHHANGVPGRESSQGITHLQAQKVRRLIAEACGHGTLQFRQSDVHSLDPARDGRFDLVLCLGLIYHLENPVGALRTARALTADGGLCLVETQVAPGLSGAIDYGHHTFVKPLMGSFAIVDETDETHGPETSTTGICLVPSLDALLWILRKVGFRHAQVLPVPAGGYEQLAHGKRVMVAASA